MGLSSFLALVRQKLSRVFQRLTGSSARSPHTTAPTLTTLARFLFERKHFSGKRVKPPGFTPPKSGKLSAFWIDELTPEGIWPLGDLAGNPRGKPALAFAELERMDVAGLGLVLEDDPKPHPRHVNICGWPTEKDEIKSLALELCARAKLHVRGER